jgi:hypothetical protein
MLAIRDTIQSPVLMIENTDKTICQFFIPTNTKILYLYEVKIDNYDKLCVDHPEWEEGIIKTNGAIVNGALEAEKVEPPKAEPAPATTKTRVLKLKIASNLFDGETVIATNLDGKPCNAKVNFTLNDDEKTGASLEKTAEDFN